MSKSRAIRVKDRFKISSETVSRGVVYREESKRQCKSTTREKRIIWMFDRSD